MLPSEVKGSKEDSDISLFERLDGLSRNFKVEHLCPVLNNPTGKMLGDNSFARLKPAVGCDRCQSNAEIIDRVVMEVCYTIETTFSSRQSTFTQLKLSLKRLTLKN